MTRNEDMPGNVETGPIPQHDTEWSEARRTAMDRIARLAERVAVDTWEGRVDNVWTLLFDGNQDISTALAKSNVLVYMLKEMLADYTGRGKITLHMNEAKRVGTVKVIERVLVNVLEGRDGIKRVMDEIVKTAKLFEKAAQVAKGMI